MLIVLLTSGLKYLKQEKLDYSWRRIIVNIVRSNGLVGRIIMKLGKTLSRFNSKKNKLIISS